MKTLSNVRGSKYSMKFMASKESKVSMESKESMESTQSMKSEDSMSSMESTSAIASEDSTNLWKICNPGISMDSMESMHPKNSVDVWIFP